MSRAAIVRPEKPAIDLLELASGLAAITAGSLWLLVYVLTDAAPELCSTTPRLISHCALCYPAAVATLAALIGGVALLRRRAH
jgi:hypothetical protein